MAVSTQTVGSLNAFFKQVFAPSVVNLIPEHEVLLKSIDFVSADKRNGGDYIQPVVLSKDHGVSYHGQNDSQLKLNPPVQAIIDSANIKASAMTMRSFLSYTAASRAVAGPRAFVDATGYSVKSLTESFSSIIEQTHWFGGMGLAAIGTTSVGTTGANNVRTDTNAIVIDQAEWSAATFCGSEGMQVSLYNTATGAKLLDTEVTAVDITARTLTLASVTGITNGVGATLYRQGAKGMESLGLHYILQNSGTLFGVDASQRGLWKANQYNVAGLLSFGKVAEAIAIAYGRGLIGKMTMYVNSRTFATMFPDFNTVKNSAGSNVFDSRVFTDADQVANLSHGVKALKFYVNSVELDVVATDYAKIGYGYGVAADTLKRVGSTEMTFDIPGSQDGVYFRDVSEYAALELRAFVDEALFCEKPARNILLSGITV